MKFQDVLYNTYNIDIKIFCGKWPNTFAWIIVYIFTWQEETVINFRWMGRFMARRSFSRKNDIKFCFNHLLDSTKMHHMGSEVRNVEHLPAGDSCAGTMFCCWQSTGRFRTTGTSKFRITFRVLTKLINNGANGN